MLTKGRLAVLLSQLKGFNKPNPALEQYTIPSEIAATVLWEMLLRGDIVDKAIADIGAGTGILGLGAAILGARRIYLIDIDKEALDIAKQNAFFMEEELGVKLPIVFMNREIGDFKTKVDVVIQNPPFGVQKEHADKAFLKKAFTIAPIIYSFHKAESERFLKAFAQEHGFVITNNWLFSWPLPATMRHHEKRKHIIKVGAWRFEQLTYLKKKN